MSLKQGVGLTFPQYIKNDSLEKPINYKKSLSDKLRLNIIEGEYDKDNTIVVQEDGGMISHSGLYANPTKLIDVKFVEESFEFPYPNIGH